MKLKDRIIMAFPDVQGDPDKVVQVVIEWLGDQKVALDRKKLQGHTIEQLITTLHTEGLT